ncbi:hypothetical protein [Pseudobacter ginsenosidimutans]|uniref:Uncharacterized protein n=1 Tax=Pseudobacter ginsenosidimutans TaxID=661488 RepID=A0A4Q7M8G6_9BACT|nr:hypothetical protein [Pseudobacter ginsenosidimutans]QEC42617.1 hypothetical protein FSB84_13290 [Pseudobacter ginsenosidimutans]RZS63891.1 hypothetical protein EV199_5989 [Pseudobacter ginsenosidimutans]
MLSAKERRFIKYWEEQRVGGQRPYLILYILTGTFISTIIVFFLFAMLGIDLEGTIWMVPVISVIAITVISVTTWKRNEKRFKEIVKREMEEGMGDGENHTNGK